MEAILRLDATKLPATTGVPLGAGGYLIARVEKILPPEDSDAAQLASTRQLYEQAWAASEAQSYYELLAQQYGACHNIKDLSICGQALKETFPQLVPQFEHVLNSNIIIPYIIGIMPVGQFKDYFEFLYKVLCNVLEKIGCKTYEELLEHVKTTEGYNVKMEDRDNRPEYQVRIVSFLAERLSTLYWLQCSKQVPVFPAQIIKTEGAF